MDETKVHHNFLKRSMMGMTDPTPVNSERGRK